jgi:hypothetical protein
MRRIRPTFLSLDGCSLGATNQGADGFSPKALPAAFAPATLVRADERELEESGELLATQ